MGLLSLFSHVLFCLAVAPIVDPVPRAIRVGVRLDVPGRERHGRGHRCMKQPNSIVYPLLERSQRSNAIALHEQRPRPVLRGDPGAIQHCPQFSLGGCLCFAMERARLLYALTTVNSNPNRPAP